VMYYSTAVHLYSAVLRFKHCSAYCGAWKMRHAGGEYKEFRNALAMFLFLMLSRQAWLEPWSQSSWSQVLASLTPHSTRIMFMQRDVIDNVTMLMQCFECLEFS
jgi:hypothetical protein